jgi:two-component system chemotaxis sensor kinase CheA
VLVLDDPALLAPRLAGLAVALAALIGGTGGEDTAATARAAAEAATAFNLPQAEALLRLAEDLADRTLDPDAVALLAAEGPALVERLRQAAEGGAAAIRALAPPGTPAEAETTGLPGIPAEFLPVLGPEGRRRAAAALAGGIALYRVRLAIGRPAEEEEAASFWLAEAGEVLTSRSLLDGNPPQLDMLLAIRQAPEPLRAALALADPRGITVLAFEPLGAIPAQAIATPVTMRVRQDTIDGIIALEAEVRAAALALSESLREAGTGGSLATLGALERRLGGSAARELAGALDRLRGLQAQLERSESRLSLSLRQLDDAVMELRVVPLGTLFQRLPRVVRATADNSGKQVELVLEGQEVTLDRSLVELLADPLLHLTRNAVDHGVEPPAERLALGKPPRAMLRVRAERRGGQVRLEVEDDGRGIDRVAVLRKAVERGLVGAEAAPGLSAEQVQALLFRPGFSTRDAVTETSGRGVGLDVVQDAVRRAGGALEMQSRPGAGTCFVLTLPLTAAVQAVLLVEVGGHPYALPAGRVEAVLDAGTAPAGQEVMELGPLLGLAERNQAGGIVMVRSRGISFGLAVDRVQRRTDLLLRPLHPALAAMPGIGGVGVLGNGDPVVVLEPDGLVTR